LINAGQRLGAVQLLRMLSRAIAHLHEAEYDPAGHDADAVDCEAEALRRVFWTGHLVSGEITRPHRPALVSPPATQRCGLFYSG
jgi:hypothetical protein